MTVILAGTVIVGAWVSSIVNVASFVISLPQASVKVKVTVALPVAPQSSLSDVKLWVTVAVPLHTSLPEKLANQLFSWVVLPLPSHSTVRSDGAAVQVGSVTSTIVNVASFVISLPQASVKVKVTVALPVAPQSSLSDVKLWVTVAVPLHTSLSEKLANQLFIWVVLPLPSHSTVRSDGAAVQVGSVTSTIVNVASFVISLPQASVKVKVTVALPVAPHRSLSDVKLWVTVAVPLHTSLSEKLANQLFIWVVLPLPSHSTVRSDGAAVQVGSVTSTIVNVASFVISLPPASV